MVPKGYNYVLKVSRKNHYVWTVLMTERYEKEYPETKGQYKSVNTLQNWFLTKFFRDYDKLDDNGI